MLATLIGSRPQESNVTAGMLVSVVIHGALIVMAVVETTLMPARTHDTPDVTSVVYFPPRPVAPATPAPVSPTPSRPVERSVIATVPVIQAPPTDPAPTGPTHVSVGATILQNGAGVATGGSADPSAVVTSTAPGAGNAGAGTPLTGDEVERAVQALRPVPPRYPEMLRAAGVTGTVRVRFVVDTAGAVEPASIEMLEAPQEAFGEAVRRALLATRYRPAEANAQRVRQLVEQAFTFQLRQ